MNSDETRKRNPKSGNVNGSGKNGEKKTKGQPIKMDSKKKGVMSLKTRIVLAFSLVIISCVALYLIVNADAGPSSEPVSKKNKRQPQEKTTKDKYSKASLTNDDDMKIRLDLDLADSLVLKGEHDSALAKYDNIIGRFPDSPRAHYGKANALNVKAEKERSNDLLEKCIHYYHKVVHFDKSPPALVHEAAMLGAERMTFRGWYGPSVKLISAAVQKYPDDLELRNKLGVAYLLMNHIEQAREAFKEVLKRNPDEGFALVHLGFIKKTNDARVAEAIPLLKRGLELKPQDKDDGKFYFHLGDALYRNNQTEEAYALYSLGASKGLFASMWQRSLHNVPGLAARPWWTQQQTGYARHLQLLEQSWEQIRDEALALMNKETGEFDKFQKEDEQLTNKGDWRQFTLFARGQKLKKNCAQAPVTCRLIEQMPEAAWCKRGQVKFSVMQPGVHVWPHCGPTNCRIRAHLGLIVPEGPLIRVANETNTWSEGKVIIFDDSFEHEVWHKGSQYRLVLIVDFWHPELNENEKATLTAI